MLGRLYDKMNLIGDFSFNGTKFFLGLHDVKNIEEFLLISPIHVADRVRVMEGLDKAENPILKYPSDVKGNLRTDYVVEVIQRRKKTGIVKRYGESNVLIAVTDAIGRAKSHQFEKKSIFIDEKEFKDGKEHRIFQAADSDLQFYFETNDGVYSYLRVQSETVTFELKSVPWALNTKEIPLEEAKHVFSKRVLVSSIKQVDYNVLAETLDMSWYKENGVKKKDYKSIDSIETFETLIMTPMLQKIEKCKKENKVFNVAVDTETTGLKVYNLAKNNPDKDHCVAIPICWEVGKSFVIFTDMEHFNNVPNEYAINRLAMLFENFEGERTIEYWVEDEEAEEQSTEQSTGQTQSMDAFNSNTEFDAFVGDDFSDDGSDGFRGDLGKRQDKKTKRKKYKKQFITITRDLINLIGHNSGFDGRVFFDFGKKFYFNEDTLQMAFDINPSTVRNSKGLKVLTRFFFNAETPELSDVLGKGNEDKYRYLQDREVAEIYGCADADYTLAIFYKLRALMTDKMYFYYKMQDIPMINILYQSEYWGMQTIEEDLAKLSEASRQNISTLQETMYSYVGVYVQYSEEVKALEAKKVSGLISEEEFEAERAAIKPDPNAIYRFDFKPAQLKNVLFDIMKYPVVDYTNTNQPALNKHVVEKLLKKKLEPGEKHFREMTRDVLVYGADYQEYEELKIENPKKAKSMVLISAEEFNSLKYPLALIIQKYSDLNKEYTAYFKPTEENNLEGKIFKGYNLARIETRRISNPGQTMKGSLKALIRSYTDDYYVLDFDMSQVEQRIMVSMSGYTALIEKMKDPENDAHTETASMVEGKPPYKISKKERKKAKSVTFGVPYGLGLRSLCEKMFGDTSKDHMIETSIVLDKWMKNNKPIVDMLEKAREEALTEWEINNDLRDFMGAWKKDKDGNFLLDENGKRIPKPVGKVENMLGFYRVFDLSDVDQSESARERRREGEYTPAEASIRRKAGNYPIQATASELFRQILIRFYRACKKYGIEDKVKWHMLIHDELLCSVKKDVHPFLIYKIVKEACMITLEGHTKYYVGINIGDTWAQCKDDSREAPIHFVERMVKRYEAGEFKDQVFDHPWEFIKPYREKYVEDRIGEVVREIQPDADTAPIDLQHLIDNFSNYTVRAYVSDYPMNGEVDYKVEEGNPSSEIMYDNLKWVKSLESWALDVYGEGKKFISLEGKEYSVTKAEKKEKKKKEIDYDELFEKDFEFDSEDEEDNFWSFDASSAEIVYGAESEELVETREYDDGSDLKFDLTRKGDNVTDLTIIESKYHNLKVLNNQIVISLDNRRQISLVEKLLGPVVIPLGTRVVFRTPGEVVRWDKIKENYDLEKLDVILEFIKHGTGSLIVDDDVYANVVSRKREQVLTKTLAKYPGSDYRLVMLGSGSEVYFSKKVSLEKLEMLIEKVNK